MIGCANCVVSWLVTVADVNVEALEPVGTAIRAASNTNSRDLDISRKVQSPPWIQLVSCVGTAFTIEDRIELSVHRSFRQSAIVDGALGRWAGLVSVLAA